MLQIIGGGAVATAALAILPPWVRETDSPIFVYDIFMTGETPGLWTVNRSTGQPLLSFMGTLIRWVAMPENALIVPAGESLDITCPAPLTDHYWVQYQQGGHTYCLGPAGRIERLTR